MDTHKTRNSRPYGWLLLIMLAAILLRFYDIDGTPPGLTHDEADHGITAWDIVNGERQIYFTVGYGREPLFDYSTAGLMFFIGPTYLAARVIAVFYGLILIAAQFAWVRQAFDRSTALMAAAGLAVGFWAVMSSRQSLRSITLPALFVLVVCCFWLGLRDLRFRLWRLNCSPYVIAGILLGLSLYTYIPARALWLIFPSILGHLAIVNRAAFRHAWRGTILMLLLAAAIGVPLFYYLYTHPTAEVRIEQLSAPLKSLLQGNFDPIRANSIATLSLFTVSGDSHWRYNIPGKPWLPPVMGALFYLGLVVAGWRSLPLASQRQQSTAYFGILLWLVAGMVPVLITGPELSMTQAIGIQPILYLFPALGLSVLGQALVRIGRSFPAISHLAAIQKWLFLVPLTLFIATGLTTARDYFVRWARDPQVRVQYETTMVAAMRYLNGRQAGAVAVSTTTPGQYHSPAVAQMTLRNPSAALRWFDGRSSLVLATEGQTLLVETGFARLSPMLAEYLQPLELVKTVPLPPTDQDQPLNIYRVDGSELATRWRQTFSNTGTEAVRPVNFGDVAEFVGYELRSSLAAPGDRVQLATLWRVKNPLEDAMLFTHVQGAGGVPTAQADQLGVPGSGWYPGDLFIQLHQVELPADMMAGVYPLVIGLCQQTSSNCQRLPILNGAYSDDVLYLTDLSVTQ